jgi:hypothetical protein
MENQDAPTVGNQDAPTVENQDPDPVIAEPIIAEPDNTANGNPAKPSAKPTKTVVKAAKSSAKHAKPTAKPTKTAVKPTKSSAKHSNPTAKPANPPANYNNPVKPVNPQFKPPSKVSLT